jgi:class 3 adenylate cyclase/TolB-like protein/cytochrome c-type biogenesis protein CcmH/NrfG
MLDRGDTMKTVTQLPVAMKAQRLTSDPAQFQRREDAAAGRVERRLAAILAADVAGYSRLVGADEQGTLAQWRAHWDELIEPKIREHQGRVVRITGDGILAEFASVVNAVRCAVALQRGMAERNADIASGERMEFRVGLNVGDVIIDRGDMWGEGVNVAARLEALAEPGGLCVSGRVQEEVRDKLDIIFEDMGKRQLKNIARPVRVYRARLDGIAAAGPPPALPDHASATGGNATSHGDRKIDVAPVDEGRVSTWRRVARNLLFAVAVNGLGSLLVTAAWWLAPSPFPSATPHARHRIAPASEAGSSADELKAPVLSIVALPFVNLSGDARQDYVADGITDSLTSDLARALPGIFVVSRDTAFTYKGRGADARQIGRELQVRYLLEGSVLLEGERVRVNIRLVETKEGSQLWAERFDTERRSILQVQDEIVGRVSRAIGLTVVDIEARRSWLERPSSAELIDLIMRGKAVLNRPSSPATMIEARGLFEQALTVQPTDVDGLAGVAATLVFEFLNGYYETGGDKRLHRAELLLDRALTVEPRHLMALKAKAALRRAQGKFDDAIAAAEAVIMENPGEPWAYKEIGLSTMYLGRPEQALDWFAKADRIGPRDPGRWTWLDGRGHALILLGRHEEAIRSLISALDANPRSISSQAFLAAAYALLGRSDEARTALAAYDQRRPGTRVSTFRRLSPVPLVLTSPKYQQQLERLNEGLRRAGMPE